MKLLRVQIGLILAGAVMLSACNQAPPPAPAPAEATAVSVLTDPATATAEAGAAPAPAATAEVSAAPALTSTVETAAPEPSPSPTFSPTPLPEATAAPTLAPTATLTPTVPASPTPDAGPVIKIDETLTTAVNVRAGPGTNYQIVGTAEPGQSAPVTGRNEDSSWWQVNLAPEGEAEQTGWIFGQLATLSGDSAAIPVAAAPPPPTPAPQAAPPAEQPAQQEEAQAQPEPEPAPGDLADQLRCGKDFCVTYQAMVPIWENGGCIGNHSIYITVLEGPPPGRPVDGVVIGDTFNNVEVASGDKGPGQTEITLWMNSMSVMVKRHINGTPYTSEESFNFTSHDELIPAEVLAANGYCEGSVAKCQELQKLNQICRGHYSWRVTFHKFD